MSNGQSRSLPPGAPDHVVALAPADGGEAGGPARGACVPEPGTAAEFEIGAVDPVLWRRRLRHDIRHELGTVIMLASAVVVADDIGTESRQRIEQLLGETRWLDHLVRQLEEDGEIQAPSPERIRADELVAEVVAGLRLATPHQVGLSVEPAWACVDPLSLWRAVRNILDNACRVAAHRVDVQVRNLRGWVSVQVDDDGPGFGSGSAGLGSMGLGIVHDLVSGYGGSLEIRRCEMGGAGVRILLPAVPPGPER